MQTIHKEFINERESRNNHQDSHSRLQNIDDLTDMGFNLTRFSPILTIGDMAPQTPDGSGTMTPVLTSIPRPNGGSRLHSSDSTSSKRDTHEGNLHNSFTGVVGQVEQQNPMGAESGPGTSGTGDSTPTFDTTKFYPGEVPFRNQGTSTSPRETSGTQTNHQLLWEIQKSCPHNKIQAREVRKRVHIRINLKHNHNQAPAMVAPTQPQYFHLGMQVQVGHTYNAQLVVEMITSERIVNKIISAPGVD